MDEVILSRIRQEAYEQGYQDGKVDGYNLAGTRMSSAKQERKKGKWTRHGIGHENVPWGFDCSACGKWFVIGEDTAERYNYCPNCGSDMRVETENGNN